VVPDAAPREQEPVERNRAFMEQVAVVTGASSGVGKAIAHSLAAGGASVCMVGRNLAALEAMVDGGTWSRARMMRAYRADLAVDDDLRALVKQLEHDTPHIDVLVHSAGVIKLGRLEEAPVEDFDRQYRTNVRAPYLLTQALLPRLRARRGQIVFINSSVGISAKGEVSQYAASKHALRALADSVRQEVNADGLRVLSVFLGRTATPMMAAIHQIEGRTYHPERLVQPEDVAFVVVSMLALPRTAEVTDVNIRPLGKPW
jgi:NAD(P)-dependent dehydrogenase (short-subunit alcohol dehydrogenase family)